MTGADKGPSVQSILPCPDIWVEVAAERERAHAKHRETSMEQQPVDALLRLSILTEEVGEVAKEMNDARHYGRLDHAALRSELVQVAAMAGAWAAALTATVEREAEEHRMSVCRWCDHESGVHIFSHGYGQDGCEQCDCTGYAKPLPPGDSAGQGQS
jgi:NTP pyrophosphatase (non-canonical NTP hydrolase)